MTNCTLCQQEITGGALGCSLGTICMKCSKDITLAEYQPLHSFNTAMWVLAETFFRRGQGEDISFEEVWNKGQNLKLVKFENLIGEFLEKSKGGEEE